MRVKALALLFVAAAIFSAALLPDAIHAQVTPDCTITDAEPHPLRPYPGVICGPEALRTMLDTNKPYCAYRPWATKPIQYMKNMEDCELKVAPDGTDWNAEYPCIMRDFDGLYTILLHGPAINKYDMPLVSVTRDIPYDLTFFNRAQQHLADYIEGRTYYDKLAEPDWNADTLDRIDNWNRLGLYRKLTALEIQNKQRIGMIDRAGIQEIHNYIVSWVSGGNPADWQTGSGVVRMTDFSPSDRQSPLYSDYACWTFVDNPEQYNDCVAEFQADLEAWLSTMYGRLWPYVPMFSREDSLGYVQINPEPDQWFNWPSPGETWMAQPVFIPHILRLKQASEKLGQLISTNVVTGGGDPNAPPGSFPLANCNPGVTATDPCIYNADTIEQLALNWISGEPGNQVQRCYGDVISRARAEGWNERLAMAMWLNESNASNYNLTGQDFGWNDPSTEYNFDIQITNYLNSFDAYRTVAPWVDCFNPSTPINPATGAHLTLTETFLWIYRTGYCDMSDTAGAAYVDNIKNIWDWFGPGGCAFPSSPK